MSEGTPASVFGPRSVAVVGRKPVEWATGRWRKERVPLFWVCILRCADGSYYNGHTDNLNKRIGEHTSGAILSCYTFKRRPLELVFSQDLPTREGALASERQVKGWSRKKKEAMMRGDWADVSRLARSARREDASSVRPEPVEGRGRAPSVHGSTSSPRTDEAAPRTSNAAAPRKNDKAPS